MGGLSEFSSHKIRKFPLLVRNCTVQTFPMGLLVIAESFDQSVCFFHSYHIEG